MSGTNPNPAGSTYGSSTAGGGSSATGTSDTSATGTGSTADDTSAQSGSGKLPRTASDLPLLTAIGLLALAGALTVRSLARRDA
ncbi:MAG TPA: hypothetical protein VE075_03900 [Thermoanaerobaculia bacterium]|nr:hypothetical protein [Thermoanaerobaculia bacterium]